MPTLSEQAQHIKQVAQWKLDQQSRILKMNSQLREIENRIPRYKSDLADLTLILFAQKNLKDEKLIEVCKKIEETKNEINQVKLQIEAVQAEKAPELVVSTQNVPINESGLICPKCGKKLIGEFCPDDGSRGVREVIEPPSGLVCPKCGSSVPVKFCPKCGTEGVPVTTNYQTPDELKAIEPAPPSKESQPEAEPGVPICPKCGASVPMRFCPKCGTEVLKPEPQITVNEKPKAKKKTGG